MSTRSMLFHWAFILILAGVIYGKGTGFSGYAVVVEGDTWIDAGANYNAQIRTGRFFGGDFTGTGLRLREFESDFRRTGQPMDFVSRVDLLNADGSILRSQDIRVNHPANVNGISIYQINFGWAPRIVIEDEGGVAFDDTVVMDRDPAPEGVVDFAMPWRGFVKLPGDGPGGDAPDRAIELELWPDSRALVALALLEGQEPQAMLEEFSPVIRYTVYDGQLTELATNTLDTSFMKETGSGLMPADGTIELNTGTQLVTGDQGSGPTMSFPELQQYSVFQVSRDAGVPLVLLAAILILVGLLPALYTSRRKVWVRADPAGDGSVLKVGGFALQRKPQFEMEFAKLLHTMTEAAGGPLPPGDPEPQATAPEPTEPEAEETVSTR